MPVHYAGVACEMDTIMAIASRHKLLVIEDAAQGIMASYKGRALGSIGHFGCFSFHETKNIISGEGGALLINDDAFADRAEIIREKGTNRSQFFRGEVDKYTWVDIGSSYLPGEIIAAFLWAQLQHADEITQQRLKCWNTYNAAFDRFKHASRIQLPNVPGECVHNAHMFYLILKDQEDRDAFIDHLKTNSVHCVFHYVPLHASPEGIDRGVVSSSLCNTEELSRRLVRLPLWVGLNNVQDYVISTVHEYLNQKK